MLLRYISAKWLYITCSLVEVDTRESVGNMWDFQKNGLMSPINKPQVFLNNLLVIFAPDTPRRDFGDSGG